MRERRDRPLFIIDIAVPRDIDPKVNELDGVYLYDIDSLQSIAEQSLALRHEQIAAAESIITKHVTEFGELVLRALNSSSGDRGQALDEGSLRPSEL